MNVAMVGLGKMGLNMAKRLTQHNIKVVGYDPDEAARNRANQENIGTAKSLGELKDLLSPPRIAWVMVPAGEITNGVINSLSNILESGDLIVDGGNSNYQDAPQIEAALSEKGVGFIDAGTSGGIWGLTEGYCLMVGGKPEVVKIAEPVFLALAPDGGYAHVGPIGAGHFVKMVHNGIEYGLLQAYGEGFAILNSAKEFSLDLHEIASIWRYGSVVRSWLLELLEIALRDESSFDKIKGFVVDSGEGKWTALEAIKRDVPAPIITTSLYERFSSRGGSEFSNRVIAALRNQFGGHEVEHN